VVSYRLQSILTPANDFQLLLGRGFNAVRLGVMWPGVEPQRGQYNDTYLGIIVKMINDLGAAGIYTIIDFHQDLWSEHFCGEGIPSWAVETRGAPGKIQVHSFQLVSFLTYYC
jgi:endoglycosylceramidase